MIHNLLMQFGHWGEALERRVVKNEQRVMELEQKVESLTQKNKSEDQSCVDHRLELLEQRVEKTEDLIRELKLLTQKNKSDNIQSEKTCGNCINSTPKMRDKMKMDPTDLFCFAKTPMWVMGGNHHDISASNQNAVNCKCWESK